MNWQANRLIRQFSFSGVEHNTRYWLKFVILVVVFAVTSPVLSYSEHILYQYLHPRYTIDGNSYIVRYNNTLLVIFVLELWLLFALAARRAQTIGLTRLWVGLPCFTLLPPFSAYYSGGIGSPLFVSLFTLMFVLGGLPSLKGRGDGTGGTAGR